MKTILPQQNSPLNLQKKILNKDNLFRAILYLSVPLGQTGTYKIN